MELWCLQFHGMSVVEALEAIERKVGILDRYIYRFCTAFSLTDKRCQWPACNISRITGTYYRGTSGESNECLLSERAEQGR